MFVSRKHLQPRAQEEYARYATAKDQAGIDSARPIAQAAKKQRGEQSILKLTRTHPTKIALLPDTEIVRRGNFVIAATLDGFLYFTPIVFGFGFAADADQAVLNVVQSLRANLATTSPEFAQAALDLAALIAAQNRDPELADAVSAVAVERLVATHDVDVCCPQPQ